MLIATLLITQEDPDMTRRNSPSHLATMLVSGLALAALSFRGEASSITSSTTQLQGVYGGSILALAPFPKPDDPQVTRLLVSTYSATRRSLPT